MTDRPGRTGPATRPSSSRGNGKDAEPPRHIRVGNRALEWSETLVYAGIAILLVITAASLLVVAARYTGDLFAAEAGNGDAAVKVLDTLLLVFIVVELLYAVRITIARRELIAEPFLLVGIIASIKEIVVLSVKAADEVGKGRTFTDSVWEIGVLGGMVVLLGSTAWLLRRKEREPGEGGENAENPDVRAR